MSTGWEAAYAFDWRDPTDSTPVLSAQYGLQPRITALGWQPGSPPTTQAQFEGNALDFIRQRLINPELADTLIQEHLLQDPVHPGQLFIDPVTGHTHSTLLILPYPVTKPAVPPAFPAIPAVNATAADNAVWQTNFANWQVKYIAHHSHAILSVLDPDHDGLANADEHRLGLSPRIPDYAPTSGRDTDGDGFTDAQELTAGTNYLDRTQFPPFTLHVISGSSQVVKIHQELPLPLVLEARSADGTPQPGIALTVTTSLDSNLVLLSGSDATDDWWPKTLQTTTGADGRATIRVKAPNTAVTLRVTATAALKTTTKVVFSATVSTLIGDVDGDGMPDAWETKAAQNGQPAHALNKSSALDAAASPLGHAYHRDTPLPRLPASIQAQLLALRDSSGFLSDYSPGTSFATDRFTAAQRAILARVDPDHDGWSNLEEYQHGTHPRLADNPATALRDDDGDGLPNLWEHQFSLNFSDARDADLVLDPALTQAQRSELMNIKESGVVISYPETYADSWGLSQLQWEWMKRIDPDHDGWTNLEEYQNGSNPRVPDTTYLRVRRGSAQTAIAGQPLPEPVVVQAVREVVSGSGIRLGFTAMASEEMTFSGPEGMTFTSGGADSPPGINPLTLSTDETGYARVHVQAPAQTGKHTIFASLSNGRKVALSLEVQPPETGGGPGGGGPGTGAGSTQPNPEFTLQWQYVWRSALVEGRDSAGGFSYHRSQQKAAAPGVQPTRVGAEASHPPLGSSSLHYGHHSENPAQDDPGLAYTESYLYDPGWKEFPSTDFGTIPFQDWHKSAPPLNAESVLMIPFESFSPMLCGNAHDDRAFGVSRSRAEQPSVAEDGSEGRTISASVEQHRARIVAVKDGQPVVLPQGTTLTLLAVEAVTQYDTETGAGVATETRIRKTLQMVIPPGASTSTPIETEDLMSPAAPNTEKLLRLLPIDLAIDADRNGTIASGETASQAKPLRFWINNDSDTGETDKEEEGNTPDHQDGYFTNIRDLEDFQLLKVSIPDDIYTKVLNSEAQIGMKWKSTSAGSPSVKVYRVANEIDESKDYIWNKSKATSQSGGQPYTHSIATVSGGSTVWLPANALQNVNGGQHPYLLFEGAAKGSGQLCLVIKMGSGSSEAEGPGVWLKLMDVEEMFASAQGTPGMPYPNPPDHVNDEPSRPATSYQNIYWPSRGQFEQDPDESNEAIIMVHGWNMTDPDRRTFSESFFKRLWWKGYKGRFATFAWPTYNPDDDALGFIPDHYNRSEYVAWKYGPALKTYVDSISKGSKHVAAHSMGNVVMASALKSGLSVGSYVAMEAAIPSGCYDASDGNNSYQPFTQFNQSDPTPDNANPDLGYRGLMAGVGGNFFDFHSANDYALATGQMLGQSVSWEGNQITYKPNGFGLKQYRYHPSAAFAERCEYGTVGDGEGTPLWTHGRYLTDHHEIMSFIARPRSRALGVQATAGFTNFDLRHPSLRYPFGTDRTEHSGQYQRPIQKTHMFFNTLLQRMNVGFNDLDDSTL